MSKVIGKKRYRVSSTTGEIWVLECRHNTWSAWIGQDWHALKTSKNKEALEKDLDTIEQIGVYYKKEIK